MVAAWLSAGPCHRPMPSDVLIQTTIKPHQADERCQRKPAVTYGGDRQQLAKAGCRFTVITNRFDTTDMTRPNSSPTTMPISSRNGATPSDVSGLISQKLTRWWRGDRAMPQHGQPPVLPHGT